MKKGEHSDSFWGALWQESLTAMTLGWELALPIFGGVLAGHFLDRWLGTGYAFTLGLLVFGIAAGFYNLWRFNQRLESRERQLEAQEHQEEES